MRETCRPAVWRPPLFALTGAIVMTVVALFVVLDAAGAFRLRHPASSATYASPGPGELLSLGHR